MEPTAAGNLLEIMDLARTLRREQLFIQHEQAAFATLTGTLEMNAATITKVGWFVWLWLTIARIHCSLFKHVESRSLPVFLSLSLFLPSSWLTSAHNKDRTCMICCWPERITIHLPAVAVRAHMTMRPFWMPNRCCPTRFVYPTRPLSILCVH